MTDMSERLKKARLEKGYTQGQFAEKIGVEPGSVSRWESGNANPRPDKLALIAEILSKPVSYFTEENKPSIPSELIARIEELEARLNGQPKAADPAVSVEALLHQIEYLVSQGVLKSAQAQIAKAFLTGDTRFLIGLSENINLQLSSLLKAQ